MIGGDGVMGVGLEGGGGGGGGVTITPQKTLIVLKNRHVFKLFR